VTPAVRQQRLPAARRRDQLLTAALAQFGAQGFHGASMDDIAEQAGVTKPVLYQHFPSKRTLYVELLETVGAEMLAAIARGAETASTPRRRVRAGFEAYFQFVCERTSSFHLLFNSAARQSGDFSEVIRGLEDAVAAVIGAFIEAPIDEDHRELLGYGIVGVAEVTARQWVRRTEEGAQARGQEPVLDPAEGTVLAQRLSDMVWAGLRSLPGEGGPGDE
jgi:AcrR family transcriptional regulator